MRANLYFIFHMYLKEEINLLKHHNEEQLNRFQRIDLSEHPIQLSVLKL